MNGYGFFKAVVLLAIFLGVGFVIAVAAVHNESLLILAVPFGVQWTVISMILAWKVATIDE